MGGPWLSWAPKQYTADLIAAAPPLEEMTALALLAQSWAHWLRRGFLPTGGEISSCCGPAPLQGGPESAGLVKRNCNVEQGELLG